MCLPLSLHPNRFTRESTLSTGSFGSNRVVSEKCKKIEQTLKTRLGRTRNCIIVIPGGQESS